MGNGVGGGSFADAGGGVSGYFPLRGDDFGGYVWGVIEVGRGGLFFSVGSSHFAGGVRAEFFPAIEDHGRSRSTRVGPSGIGVCRFCGHGLLRGPLAAGVCPDENLQSVWMVPDCSGVGLVVAGFALRLGRPFLPSHSFGFHLKKQCKGKESYVIKHNILCILIL